MSLPGRGRPFGQRRRPTELRGRGRECAVIDQLLDAVRAGSGRALVVRGEPGIGKTALLDYLAEHASGCRLARSAGVESEMELPYAALHQLLASMLHRVEQLPGPQREALATAFGLTPGSTPDRFLVGLATLSLLADVAEEYPLICLIDDEQWLDRASAQVLGFVARRLVAEPVGLVFAARVPTHDLAALPELTVEGLGDADARSLLAGTLAAPLDPQVTDRLVADARGNPLALLELPRGLTPAELAGGFALPDAMASDAMAVSGRIEESFRRRLDALPDGTRRLLLLAAAEPVGDPVLTWRAAERLGIPAEAATPAAEAGLLEVGARVRFRHPLVRSASYRAASVQDRRQVHRALAEATDLQADPDRRAWHWAHATPGPDEAIAAELERSADRAQARGGVAAAAAFLERAVTLTVDRGRRTERAVAAAQASFQAGAFEAALRLLAIAEAGPVDGLRRGRIELIRGHTAFLVTDGTRGAVQLLAAARRLEPFDLDLARKAYLTAWGAAVSAGHLGGSAVLHEVCRSVLALPSLPDDPHPLDLLLEGLAMLTVDGHAVAAPTLRRAADAVPRLLVDDVLRWGWLTPGAALAVWDVDGFRAAHERQSRLVRDAGALGELPQHLQGLAQAEIWSGDFRAAAALIVEAEYVAAATGSQLPPLAALRLWSRQGRETETVSVADATIETAAGRGQGHGAIVAHEARAVLYNGLGRYHEARSAALEVATKAIDPWTPLFTLPELVEAAVRVGDAQSAQEAAARLAGTTQPARTEYGLGMEARCRALLGEGPAAEDKYREAIVRLGRTAVRTELARAHLVFGEWLRREGRRADAREQLRVAHDMFARIGMSAFAERARRELVATGLRPRRAALEGAGALTPRQLQICRLAAAGKGNGAIAAELFVSIKTVETHLAAAYRKLGVTARKELVGRI